MARREAPAVVPKDRGHLKVCVFRRAIPLMRGTAARLGRVRVAAMLALAGALAGLAAALRPLPPLCGSTRAQALMQRSDSALRRRSRRGVQCA